MPSRSPDCALAPTAAAPAGRATPRLPMAALLALAAAGFITVLTEALPAGLLPQMGAGLGVTASLVGQLVTVYALGSLLAAIPLVAATQGMRRKPLLLVAIGGFAIVNTVTAVSTHYALTLLARFFAGVFAGLLWALIAGYAARMVPARQEGRAIAVAMVGTPLALALGIPAGTFMGAALGWQVTFGAMTVLTLLLIGWAIAVLPDFPGQAAGRRASPMRVLALPGIRSVLFAMLGFVLAHNILYTYIAPFLVPAGMAERTDVVLLVFGASALAGIWITGVLIDHHLRRLVLASTALFALSALALGLWGHSPPVIHGAVAAWGLAFGGAATLFQTALAKAAGDAADVAQALLVTTWNIAIAGGGLIGGVLLDRAGAPTLPWALVVLLAGALAIAARARQHGFPPSMRG